MQNVTTDQAIPAVPLGGLKTDDRASGERPHDGVAGPFCPRCTTTSTMHTSNAAATIHEPKAKGSKLVITYTIIYYTTLYYTILYYTILYYTILYYTILYYTDEFPLLIVTSLGSTGCESTR